jgi:hypothetical protein
MADFGSLPGGWVWGEEEEEGCRNVPGKLPKCCMRHILIKHAEPVCVVPGIRNALITSINLPALTKKTKEAGGYLSLPLGWGHPLLQSTLSAATIRHSIWMSRPSGEVAVD